MEPTWRRTLIVCCDGTWQNGDNGYVRGGMFRSGHLQTPSNVTRICRAIKTVTDKENVSQVLYYQAGVGTGVGLWSKIAGGGTGLGLAENCREAYSFLANNYEPGDRIVLVGFSRGAFTARSIAGLIGCIGLLTKAGLGSFVQVFQDYENCRTPGYSSEYPDLPFPDRPNFTDPRYAQELEKRELTRRNVPIKAVAVWDTVGSLGLPNVSWLEQIGIFPDNREYAFFDTKLNPKIEYAFQALALDEQRGPFSPAIWEKPNGSPTVWFPGVHGNAGGGSEDVELSNITLAWMMEQLSPFVEFDRSYVREQYLSYRTYRKGVGKPLRAWACGRIQNSLKGFHVFAGAKVRTPGQYFAADPNNGRATSRLLENTNESMHPSVRIRHGLADLGVDDQGPYQPPALKDWKLMGAEKLQDGSTADRKTGPIWWQYTGKDSRFDSNPNKLYEDQLGELELELLRHDSTAFGGSVPKQYAERLFSLSSEFSSS